MFNINELIKEQVEREEIRKKAKKIKALTKREIIVQAWKGGLRTNEEIFNVLKEAEDKGLLIRRPSKKCTQRSSRVRLKDQTRWYLSQLTKEGAIDRIPDLRSRPYDIEVSESELPDEAETTIVDSLSREIDALDLLVDDD